MRNRRRHLASVAAVLLLILAATPTWDSPTPTGRSHPQMEGNSLLGDAELASDAQKPFLAPRWRPTDTDDPNRNAYSVPEAPLSPACSRHFCVHWVEEGL